MQAEGVLGGDRAGALAPRVLDQLGQQPLALGQRARRSPPPPPPPSASIVVALGCAAPGRRRPSCRPPRRTGPPRTPSPMPSARPWLDRAAQDPAQDVAAVLVGRHHAVGHQERGRAAVVGQHAQRARGGVVLPVAAPRALLAELDQRAEGVGLVDRRHVLQDRRHPVEPHAGVDVLLRQLGQRAVGVQLVLHEHEVPELQVALGVVAGAVVVGAERRAAVQVQLRARAARPRRAGLPEVVLAPEPHDALVGHADRAPALDRLLVGAEAQLLVAAEHGDPDGSGVEAEALGGELPGELRRALLEVVADREVAEHLEEGEVARGQPHVLDVGGAKHLLAGGQPPRRRLLLPAEVGLERLHARGGEQHRGVVAGRHQRRRGHAQVRRAPRRRTGTARGSPPPAWRRSLDACLRRTCSAPEVAAMRPFWGFDAAHRDGASARRTSAVFDREHGCLAREPTIGRRCCSRSNS